MEEIPLEKLQKIFCNTLFSKLIFFSFCSKLKNWHYNFSEHIWPSKIFPILFQLIVLRSFIFYSQYYFCFDSLNILHCSATYILCFEIKCMIWKIKENKGYI